MPSVVLKKKIRFKDEYKMLGFIQKLGLTIISAAFTLVMGFGIYTIIVVENGEWIVALAPIVLLGLSALSFVHHLRTIGFYKRKDWKGFQFKKELLFWICTLVFALALIVLAGFFVYVYNQINSNGITKGDEIFTLIFLTMFFLGLAAWNMLDARYVYLRSKEVSNKAYIDQIDAIQGKKVEEEGM